MKTLLVGVVLGFLFHILLSAVGDYLYVSRDNVCWRKGENAMKCNRYNRDATIIEKLSNFRLNAACWTAAEDLKFIYCDRDIRDITK